MDATPTPTVVGAFVTAFLSLIGVVVWALRQQLQSSQKLIETTIPQQQQTYVAQMDKYAAQIERIQQSFASGIDRLVDRFREEEAEQRDFHQRQIDNILRTFVDAHKETLSWMRSQSDSLASAQKVLEQHTAVLERQSQAIERQSQVLEVIKTVVHPGRA